ncbi:O-antigen ligase [Paenibacillus sp. UNCCL117]|uniref:O-antigen ligase family protein n=1 Tax=unclassified Paenibacillus TaxID=185978 RepID=UPI0008917BCB|nr:MULTISPECIES: O-antigen ligase family protein [unclassified Paenibacillus]SDD91288.1 O-antigen ligase [Paenibacillus sp. cl123]SFW43741.1 O-antigen ligase [Paenibacillus sp. UNCCL117]
MGYKNPRKGYYGTKDKTTSPSSSNSLIFWTLMILTSIFLFWAPFQRGLFNGNQADFEGPIFSSLLWTCILLFLFSIYLFSQWRIEHQSDLLVVAIWLMPLSYLISMISAASSTFAFSMLCIQIVYVTFFLLAYYISNNKSGLILLKNVIISSAYFIVIFGLMNWLGLKEIAYSIVKWFIYNPGALNYYNHAVYSDENGSRLTSVFQYANTYAGFLIAVLLVAVYSIVTSKKWYAIAIHTAIMVPIIISLLLTLSRGALVVLPVIVILVIPFLNIYKQATYLLHLIISFALTIVILNKITNAGLQLVNGYDASLVLGSWTSLLTIITINIILAVPLQLFVQPRLEKALTKLQQKRLSQVMFPVAVVIVGSIGAVLLLTDTGLTKALPENIRTRIENINFQQHSVLERGTFYKDAIKVFIDHPVIGAGGGAWSALYEKYQNNPYTSRQAHSFYLQYLGETGLVGSLILACILIAIFYIYIRNYLRQTEEQREQRFIFYIVAIALLVHSSLDFNLSYVYLGLLVFLCLGAMVSGDAIEIKTNWFQKVATYKWAFPSAMALIALVMFFTSVQLVNANRSFKETTRLLTNGVTDYNQIIAPLNQALETRPTQPEYVQQKTAILFQVYNQTKDENFYNEAVSLLDKARAKNPYDFGLISQRIQSYLMKEDTQGALDLTTAEINNFPWKVELYQTAIDLNTRLGLQAFDKKDQATQDKYWTQAIQLYSKFDARQQTLANLPKEQAQGNAFAVTPQMSMSLGQIHFLQGKYDQAEAMLRFGLNDNLGDAFTRQLTRWYLAALQKQGKNDQSLYDKLIASDANEKNEIQQLLNVKP